MGSRERRIDWVMRLERIKRKAGQKDGRSTLFVSLVYSLLPILSSLSLLSCTSKPPDGMALIPSGSFMMGSDDFAIEELARDVGIEKPWTLDASPSHLVNLPVFYIHKNEVTNEAYWRFTEAKGFQKLPHWPGGGPSDEQKKLPAVYVNWFEARAYCQWIGGSLPTEAQWEKGARGPDSHLYPWGNIFDSKRSNIGGNQSGPHPVGSLPAGNSPNGISDMIGNVWEWTGSWYEPYPGSEYSAAEYGQKYRVIRGNSFSELGHFQGEIRDQVVAAQARATYRLFLPPNGAIEDLGFRCVKPTDY